MRAQSRVPFYDYLQTWLEVMVVRKYSVPRIDETGSSLAEDGVSKTIRLIS
jgi:hypothetical protein